jgi:hypothetical protein
LEHSQQEERAVRISVGRFAALAVTVAVLSFGAAACGDDDGNGAGASGPRL